jgi:cytochrome c
MKYMPRYIPVFVMSTLSIVATATCAFAQYGNPGFSVLKAEQLAGRQLFKDHCGACHSLPGTGISYGPRLNGVVGRRAGSVARFPYSDALKESGLVWNEENLRKWIADSAHTVPNTLMPHISISDPAEQIYLIEFLKTLKAPAGR